MLIQNFTDADKIALTGYGTREIDRALHDQTTTNGSVTITLSDNTRITLSGVSHLTGSDFKMDH